MSADVIIACPECGQKNRLAVGKAGRPKCGRCGILLDDAPFDPAILFYGRKTIFDTVQEAQKAEHHALKHMGEAVIERKRLILETLSSWLLSQSPTNLPSASRDLMLATGMNLEKWWQDQAQAETLAKQRRQAQNEESMAQSRYNDLAPFGFVTEIFSDTDKQHRIDAAKQTLQAKRSATETLRQNIRANDERRQIEGERFLRYCVGNLAALQRCDDLFKEVRGHIQSLANTTQERWTSHKAQQLELASRLEAEAKNIRKAYE